MIFHTSRALKTWTKMPSQMEYRTNFYSGLVTQPDGSKSGMIAGGIIKSSSEMFDFKTNSWTKKADLPYKLGGGSTLPYRDSFIIIGGNNYDSWSESKSILYYNPLFNKWETLEEELKLGRTYFTAFYVPDQFC